MGITQFLLILASIIIFGTFNLLLTHQSIDNMKNHCVFEALVDLYEIGKDAQKHFDSTNTYIDFEIIPYKTNTPYAIYQKNIIEDNQIKILCTIKFNNVNYIATITRFDYTLTKL